MKLKYWLSVAVVTTVVAASTIATVAGLCLATPNGSACGMGVGTQRCYV